MEDVTKVFERMNLHKIRSYLLYGTDEYGERIPSYPDALQTGMGPIIRRLDNLCPEVDERDSAAADLSAALTAHQNVYMEVGMKAGARLIWQLLTDAGAEPGVGTAK